MRLRNLVIWALLDTALGFPIAALACENVRLDLDPKVLGKVPAMKQGKTSACFSTTAVQLIDSYRFSNGDLDYNFLSSPIVLGSESGDILSEGGTVKDSLIRAQSVGTCSTRETARFLGNDQGSEFLEFLAKNYSLARGRSYNPLLKQNIQSLSKTQYFEQDNGGNFENLDSLRSVTFARDMPKVQKKRPKYTADQKMAAQDICQRLKTLGLEDASVTRILEFLTESRQIFISRILGSLCKERKNLKFLPNPTMEDAWTTGPSGVAPPNSAVRESKINLAIDQALKNKRPVAIEFCNEAVTSLEHEGKYNEKGEWICEKNGQHAAVVVGSKTNAIGGCFYLVRDSYCDQYPKQWSGLSKKDVCTGGQYWIPSGRLLKNTRAAIHF